MIGISRLYIGCQESSDALRYTRRAAAEVRPIVVWNCTRRCNLACKHCYSASDGAAGGDELSTADAKAMIADIAAFGCPVLLFSGGEPLLRGDLQELISTATVAGLRTAISTNGTEIDAARAKDLANAGLKYAGVSIDGPADSHDDFRGRRGAFAQALAGADACLAAGIKTGLRFTMTRDNVSHVPEMFAILRDHRLPRICFYHFVPAGRGRQSQHQSPTHAQARAAIDQIIDGTARLHAAGEPVEVLTVDNHADGAYLYMRLAKESPARAEKCLELLRTNGGNRSGVAVSSVSWNGDVHPDQFWRTKILGNVRRTPFSRIWTDPANELLTMLRDRRKHLHGRCERCRFFDICNGNLRARAAAASDEWGDDPGCYLTESEIAPQ